LVSKPELVWTPDVICAQTGTQPEYLVQGDSADPLVAAKWNHFRSRIAVLGAAHHILLYHAAGTTAICTIVDGRVVRTRSKVGSLTFIPCGKRVEWQISGDCAVMHLYIDPSLLGRFSERHVYKQESLEQFFGSEDPWLKGFFQMLISQMEIYKDPSGHSGSSLLTQLQDLLLQHLIRWHPGTSKPDIRELDHAKLASPLRPALLRRVEDYVDAHLPEDTHLADLARLVYMSEDHFIRAFRAAIGSTPYHFVLEKRLHASGLLLRTTDYSIGEIAKLVGFRSAAYFSAKFRRRYGLTPTRYRAASEDPENIGRGLSVLKRNDGSLSGPFAGAGE